MIKFIKELGNLYYATDKGEIFAVERFYLGKTKRTIKAKKPTVGPDEDGYQKVHVYDPISKKRKRVSVHRLVLLAFQPIENSSELMVNHKNGIRHDNRLENLEWCDNSHNLRHAYSMGTKSARGSNNGQAILNEENVREIKKLLRNNVHPKNIFKNFGVSISTIKQIKNGYNWTHIE